MNEWHRGQVPSVKTEFLPDGAPRFWDICPIMMADSLHVFQLWQSVNLLLMGNCQQDPIFSTSMSHMPLIFLLTINQIDDVVSDKNKRRKESFCFLCRKMKKTNKPLQQILKIQINDNVQCCIHALINVNVLITYYVVVQEVSQVILACGTDSHGCILKVGI